MHLARQRENIALPLSYMVKDGRNQPVWPCGVYVRSLTSLIIPFFLVGRSILSLWRHRSLVIEPRHGWLLWARGWGGAWLGGKRWVRLIAGGGVGVIAEVSPAAPQCCVTPIRHQILSHLTVPDTASLRLTPDTSSISLSPLPRSLCSSELIGYFIQHRLHNSRLSFVRCYYCWSAKGKPS